MAVAVEVKHTCAPQGEACKGISLGVELDQLQLIPGEVGKKRDVMIFLHGVVQGDEELVLHPLHGQLMMLVGILASAMSSAGRVMPQQLTTACPVAWSTLPQRGQT